MLFCKFFCVHCSIISVVCKSPSCENYKNHYICYILGITEAECFTYYFSSFDIWDLMTVKPLLLLLLLFLLMLIERDSVIQYAQQYVTCVRLITEI
jgi:hypothetical protein